MNESQFRDELCEILRKSINNYSIKPNKSILYNLIVDPEGQLQPINYKIPTRGQYAFQTDILISNDKVPLVVIETKYGGFSTHDILTYSTKAIKHKEVYPYLRYGFIVGGQNTIDRKFFIHNVGFDFAIALKNLNDDLDKISEIIKNQIKSAEIMLEVLTYRLPKIYVSNMAIE